MDIINIDMKSIRLHSTNIRNVGNDLMRAMNTEERNLLLSWFGSGMNTTFYLPGISSSNSITVFEGLYNPSTFQNIFALGDSGLEGLGMLVSNQVNNVLTDESFNGLNAQDQQYTRFINWWLYNHW